MLYCPSMSKAVTVKRASAGLGLFANKDFAKGEFVIEYTGERITPDEANRRGGKYLFTVSKTCVLDAKGREHTGRYINHACKPNCFAEADEEEGRIRIYTKRRVAAGEELTYHYGKEYFEDMIGIHCRCFTCRQKTAR